uniref:Selenoprotein F n=1 Tax=Haemonchus contortus TaxID=6289 RepID=A0A7I5EBQ8_HAECO
MRRLLIGVSLYVLASAEYVKYELTYDECKEAGFVPESLKCSSCRPLPKFNLEFLLSDCLACCTKDEEDHPTYPYADIEVCDCNLARFPQAQAFVQENMAAPWGDSVKVRQVRGITPQIVLKDHSGKRIQTYNIEKWDTDTIKEFLTEFIE